MATEIKDCSFVGVVWDESAVEMVQVLFEALLANSNALANASRLLAAQNINIDALLKIGEKEVLPNTEGIGVIVAGDEPGEEE